MVSLTQSYSFSSHQETLSSSQWEQNSRSDIEGGVRRVTVRQLLNATLTSDFFEINGVGIKRVMLVANVRDERKTASGSKSYDFDDGTGRIKGYGRDKNPEFTFEQFAYARVVGELDQYKGSNTLKITNIQPVFEPHEVYFHTLHAIVETLTFERGPPPQIPVPHHHNERATQNHQVDSLSQTFQHVSLSNEATTPSTSQLPRNNVRRPQLRSKLERDIVSFIFDYMDDDDEAGGVPIVDIVAHIKASNPDAGSHDTSTAMEYLLGEDFIATAGDDHHYQPGMRFISKI